jgi:hypothetical protein
MFKIAPWYNNYQAPAVLMIDDLSDAYIDVYPETHKNDWGYLCNQKGSAFFFLEQKLLLIYPEIKITFFSPYGRHAVLNENCSYSIQKYAVGEREEYILFLQYLISKGYEIAHHGSDHGRYIDPSKCTTVNNWIHEWALFKEIKNGVEITKKGITLFKEIVNIDIMGGKYCGYISIDNSQEIIDQCNFLYWCEHGRYQINGYFFGRNHTFSFPTTFAGNSFVRLTYLTGDPQRDLKKRYMKFFQPLYNLLSYYKLHKLYKKGHIISIQEHISPSTSAGTAQSANIVSDMSSLKKIYSFLKSRSIWHATCQEIATYTYVKHNTSINWDLNKLTLDFKNIRNITNTFISIIHNKSFVLEENGIKYNSTIHNNLHVITIPITDGINKFDYSLVDL